ncbi:MAG: Abi-alpha family protein [Nitriliruptorales bacterium]|nr:Abi-alpha family protein [Nitriliruptorales bacterium]
MSDDQHATNNGGSSVLATGPALVRLAVGTAWRVSSWAVGTYVGTTTRLVNAVVSGEGVTPVLREAAATAREEAQRTLGLRPGSLGPISAALDLLMPRDGEQNLSPAELVERGQALLQRSLDVTYEERSHPAYERILTELAPDEARILRLLFLEGPQASVDVRGTDNLVGDATLIAPGITMIGRHAGCRYVERVPAYLNNLYRLGLVWFSREPIDDHSAYQVLEAQPEVADALAEAKRTKTVRRSIHLTPFGDDFCRTCFALEHRTD